MNIPKFDTAKFKDVIHRLSVFRNYSSLLVPVVIGLVGVLVFIPTQLMSSKLKKQMADESVSRGKKVRSLSKGAVAREQWKVEHEYQQVYESDANKVALLARQSSQRQLLSYKIFPEPKDTSVLIFREFGSRFRGGIDELLAHTSARDCPTDAELERGLQSSLAPSPSRRDRRRSSRIFSRGSLARLDEVNAAIIDVLCRARAESACVYANPADLSGYEFWGEYEYAGMDKAVKDCWYYQLAYWVIEDVIDTIAACNSGSNSVFTSPVKQLLGVGFTTSEKGKRFRERTVDDKPSYALSIGDGLTGSCTGRFSNDDIDVVHFRVIVVVSAKAVLPFMQRLCSAKQHKFIGFFGEGQEQIFKHNQITILESKITSINREDEAHSLYRYGEDAVVELDLICEYIYSKNGYDEIKPESIKKVLSAEEEK